LYTHLKKEIDGLTYPRWKQDIHEVLGPNAMYIPPRRPGYVVVVPEQDILEDQYKELIARGHPRSHFRVTKEI
jgi:hypothetical protein